MQDFFFLKQTFVEENITFKTIPIWVIYNFLVTFSVSVRETVTQYELH